MACIGCDFSLPKNSARAVALESRTSIRRYLEEVSLTPDEQAIVASDIENWIRLSVKFLINRHKARALCLKNKWIYVDNNLHLEIYNHF